MKKSATSAPKTTATGHDAEESRGDFAAGPSGRVLVAANRHSRSLAVFLNDPQAGALDPVC